MPNLPRSAEVPLVAGTADVAAFRLGHAYVHPRPNRPLQKGEARVAVRYLSASPGTDTHEFFTGDHPTGTAGTRVGVVSEVGEGVEKLAVGDVVYCDGQYEESIILDTNNTSATAYWGKVNPRVPEMSHTFLKLSAIALNAILDAPPEMATAKLNANGVPNPGNTVVVLGLGIIGQFVTQLALAHGAKNVVLLDQSEERIARALAANKDRGKLWPTTDIGEVLPLLKKVNSLEGRHGELADAVIEVTGNKHVLRQAPNFAGRNQRVVVSGWHHGETSPDLEHQFHVNRGTLASSQISGVRPALQAEWNRQRLVDTCLDLMTGSRPRLDPAAFVTDVRPFDDLEIGFYFDAVRRQQPGVMAAVFGFERNGAVLELPGRPLDLSAGTGLASSGASGLSVL